jgi:NADH dehydrogenase [ubiquinone] 1 alpha subcomplex assembly factor 2
MERLKMLAAQADARWEAKESFLVAPGQNGSGEELSREAGRVGIGESGVEEVRRRVVRQEDVIGSDGEHEKGQVRRGEWDEGGMATPATKEKTVMKDEPGDSPWKKAASKTMDEPVTWNPKATRRK